MLIIIRYRLLINKSIKKIIIRAWCKKIKKIIII